MAETSATSPTAGATTDAPNPPANEPQTASGEVASSESTNDPVKQVLAEDDPEVDFFGEKLKKSKFLELKTTAERAKEIERGAREKFEKTAAEKKQLLADKQALEEAQRQRDEIAQRFGEDPDKLFEHFKIDPLAYAERKLAAHLKRSQMTPEQLKAEAEQSELAQLRAYKQEQESKLATQQQEQLTHQFLQHHDKQIGQALTQYSLPKNHRNVARVAEVLAQYEEANMPIDASMAVQIVKGELQTDVKETFVDLLKTNPQLVFEMLGPDGIKAITDQRVATVTGGGPKAPQNPMPPKIETPKEPETFEEVRARLKLKF